MDGVIDKELKQLQDKLKSLSPHIIKAIIIDIRATNYMGRNDFYPIISSRYDLECDNIDLLRNIEQIYKMI